MKEILIQGLTLSYDNKIVLKDYNMKFGLRDTTCIMGESGSGKTTLLYALMRLKEADTGEIINLPKKISAVFQEDRLFEEFTVIKNILAVHENSGNRDLKNRVLSALHDVGLEDISDTKIKELSGGMKRRVAIIRAILAHSEFIIMDEPFKGIDETNKEKVLRFIRENRNNRGILFTTHNRFEAEHMNAEILELK